MRSRPIPDVASKGVHIERRPRFGLAVGALLVFSVSACAGSSSASPPSTTSVLTTARKRQALAQVRAVVALGDSVPAGTACGCTPFPALVADRASKIARHTVGVDNDSVAGYQSTDVLEQLERDASVISHVRGADVVLVEVGANDLAFSPSCATTLRCYESKLPQVIANLTSIVTRIRALAVRRDVKVVLLDYWSVWLGGKYSKELGHAYHVADDSLTGDFDDAVHTVAVDTGSDYVDLRTAFRGPDLTSDATPLLASDGDHPNAAGHRLIAESVVNVLVTS